jgi:bacteriorhodopsin
MGTTPPASDANNGSCCQWTHPAGSWWSWAPSPSFVVALSLLTIACGFYVDIFRVLSVRRQQRKSGIISCAQAEHAVALVELSTLAWTVIVAAYLLGTCNLSWFDNRREQVFYTAVDLCVKFGYSYLLCDAHINLKSLEDSHRTQMALKEEQIDKQRTFIRYGKIRGISHTFTISPKLRY